MSTKVMTVSVSPCGEIRIAGDSGVSQVFANSVYLAEEMARLIAGRAEWQQKESKVRAELTRAEKIDGTVVDLIANVRKILDEGVPF